MLQAATADSSKRWAAKTATTSTSNDQRQAQCRREHVEQSSRPKPEDWSHLEQSVRIKFPHVSLDSQSMGFDNSHGTIAAGGTLDIRSGVLTNDAGLIQAASAMSINTGNSTLVNTSSGSAGGIVGQNAITLDTGDLNNRGGFIGAKGSLTARSAAIDNSLAATLTSGQAIELTATSLHNQGGQLQALGDVRVQADAVDNTAGLVRSATAVTITADSVYNANTQATDKGIEGQLVGITSDHISNAGGAIRADNAVILTGKGHVNNIDGLVSAGGTVAISDTDAATAVAKTQTVTNTRGTLIAGQSLSVDSAGLSGDGKVLSQGDLGVKQAKRNLITTLVTGHCFKKHYRRRNRDERFAALPASCYPRPRSPMQMKKELKEATTLLGQAKVLSKWGYIYFELSALNPKRGEQPLSISLLPDASGLICFERNRMANNAYVLDPDGKMRYRLVVPWELTGRDIPATSEMWFSHVAVHEDGEFGLNAWIEGSGSGGYSEGDWYFELDYRTGRFLWGKEIRI